MEKESERCDDPIRKGRELQERYHSAIFNTQKLYPPEAYEKEKAVMAITDELFAQLLEPARDGNRKIKLGNEIFNVYELDPCTIVLVPPFSPVSLDTVFTHAQMHTGARQGLFPASNVPFIMVCTPPDWEVYDWKPNEKMSIGWFQDHGTVGFHNPEANKGLPGRDEGHADHEAWHCFLQLYHPEFYTNYIKPYPALDEMLAIWYEWAYKIAHNREDKSMVDVYTNTVGFHDIHAGLQCMPILEVNGGPTFNTNLFPSRYILSIFSYILSMANLGNIDGSDPDTPLPEAINSKLISVLDKIAEAIKSDPGHVFNQFLSVFDRLLSAFEKNADYLDSTDPEQRTEKCIAVAMASIANYGDVGNMENVEKLYKKIDQIFQCSGLTLAGYIWSRCFNLPVQTAILDPFFQFYPENPVCMVDGGIKLYNTQKYLPHLYGNPYVEPHQIKWFPK